MKPPYRFKPSPELDAQIAKIREAHRIRRLCDQVKNEIKRAKRKLDAPPGQVIASCPQPAQPAGHSQDSDHDCTACSQLDEPHSQH